MANIYNFLNNVYQEIKQENNKNYSLIFIVLVLLSVPLYHSINNICLGLLVLVSGVYFKKQNIVIHKFLLFPIFLYAIMLLSYFWTIDKVLTLSALSKEVYLLLIPVCFFFIGNLSKDQKHKIIKYYSFGIVFFSMFYLAKAFVLFVKTQNSEVFFYHELVTKDVNAIHVSVYVSLAFFYFFTKEIKKPLDYAALTLLLLMVFLLSSKNIIVVFLVLLVCYHLFYTKTSQKLRLKNLIIFCVLIFSFAFVGKIKDRFKQEYETIMTDSSVNDVVQKSNGIVYNVSIKQAWNKDKFAPNDYFPGTAFRVYQLRIFKEMLQEDPIFWKGYGLNASFPKIEAKGIEHNLFLGNGEQQGYQTKNFHNQYVQNFAELGVFGFLILIGMLFINLKNALHNKDFIHISFAILMISLFLTESFLWRQRGVVFFTVMFCLFNSGFIINAPNKKQI